jgi:exopolysaccharide biosynthesis polyprenyl glycosylphosphotransferase
MSMLPSAKFWIAAAIISAGAWFPVLYQVPVAVGAVSLVAGLVMAAVLLEREQPIRKWAVHRERAWVKDDARPSRALIIGAGAVGRELARNLEAGGGYHVVGFVDDEIEAGEAGGRPVFGGRETTAALIEQYDIDEVFLAYAPSWQQRLVEDLVENHPEVRVRVVPSPYEALMRFDRIESLGDVVVVRVTDETARPWDTFKRLFDLWLAAAGLLLLAPVLLLIAALIRLTSRGPAIYAQERIGLMGRPFTLYKFRTMVHDAEAHCGPVLSPGEEDDRLTPLGRWLRNVRLDELPQLWNVLRGEMSLVGPRPERPHFVRQFQQMRPLYAKRHQVRPGITGLAQVCGGYHTDARDKLRFDLIYVSQRSLWLDLWILLRTVFVMLRPGRH